MKKNRLDISRRSKVRVPTKLLNEIQAKTINKYGPKGPTECSLVFVSESEMAKLNRKYRKKNNATDVLAFPVWKKQTKMVGQTKPLGEIIIAPLIAKKQAKTYSITQKQEIGLLFLHALLHLIGFTHQNRTREKTMAKAEKAIVSAIPILNKAHHGKGALLRELP
jgi:probable rRNA maturation factor